MEVFKDRVKRKFKDGKSIIPIICHLCKKTGLLMILRKIQLNDRHRLCRIVPFHMLHIICSFISVFSGTRMGRTDWSTVHVYPLTFSVPFQNIYTLYCVHCSSNMLHIICYMLYVPYHYTMITYIIRYFTYPYAT